MAHFLGEHYLNNSGDLFALHIANKEHSKAKATAYRNKLAMQAVSAKIAKQYKNCGDFAVILDKANIIKAVKANVSFFKYNSCGQLYYSATVDFPIVAMTDELNAMGIEYKLVTLGCVPEKAEMFEKAACEALNAEWVGRVHTAQFGAYNPDGLIDGEIKLECKSYHGVFACAGGREYWEDAEGNAIGMSAIREARQANK